MNELTGREKMRRGKIRAGIILFSITVCVICGCTQKEEKNIEAEIAYVKYDRDTIVTIVSDDGDWNTGLLLNELSEKHGVRVTVAGIVQWIEPLLKEWKALEREGNIELISHSYTHIKMGEEDKVGEAELRHQIFDSIEFYSKNFKTHQIAFICPENTMCEAGYDILRESGIYGIRQGGRGENSLTPEAGINGGQWYSLYTHGIGDVDTTEERNEWVDNAVKNRKWLIEMWHNVSKDGDAGGYQEISYAVADEHLNYIEKAQNDERVWAATLTEAIKYIWEREYSEVKAWYDGSAIRVSLQCENLPKEIFNLPVTVKLFLPEELEELTEENFHLNNKEEVRMVTEEETVYLEFEMSPNKKDLKIKID